MAPCEFPTLPLSEELITRLGTTTNRGDCFWHWIWPSPLVEGGAPHGQSFSGGVRCHHRLRRSASQSGSRTNGQARRWAGPQAFLPPESRDQAQQPSLPEPTVQGTMAAGPATQQPTLEDQAGHVLGRRIQEARQRQCNAEWEQYDQAKAEYGKLPVAASARLDARWTSWVTSPRPSSVTRLRRAGREMTT